MNLNNFFWFSFSAKSEHKYSAFSFIWFDTWKGDQLSQTFINCVICWRLVSLGCVVCVTSFYQRNARNVCFCWYRTARGLQYCSDIRQRFHQIESECKAILDVCCYVCSIVWSDTQTVNTFCSFLWLLMLYQCSQCIKRYSNSTNNITLDSIRFLVVIV